MESSNGVQLRKLCSHILGPMASEEALSAQCRAALMILSSSSSGQENVRDNEFVVAEKIKKQLVRDGRERDTVAFTELHLKLQRSSIIRNRESILTLLMCLSERTNRGGPKKVPPFSSVSVTTINGTVESGGVTVVGAGNSDTKSFLSSVIPAPYRSRQTSLNNGLNLDLPLKRTEELLRSPDYRPPLPPKPRSIVSPSQSHRTPSLAKSQFNFHGRTDIVDGGPPKWIVQEPDTEASEKDLIRELLYVFQGIEGSILLRNSDGSFYLCPSRRDFYTPSTIQLALRLAELGWLFNTIHGFIEHASGQKDLGLVGQSLVTGLREELAEYYRLISVLEDQLKAKKANSDDEGMAMTLHKLSVYTMDPLAKMKLLAVIVKQCDRQLKGGSLLSTVYGYLHHGNKVLGDTIRKLLTSMTKPIYSTLVRWLLDGTLEDPYQEFFVASDPAVADEARLWFDKYSIRKSMIPKFLSLSWVKKILNTGKSINFLRCVCDDSTSNITNREKVMNMLDQECSAANLFEEVHDNKLLEAVQLCYTETSSLVLDTLFKRYKLIEHFSAMRKYLLLGQGDLIRYLMELLDEELSRPATSLFPHNLAGILETAIRATNAQFEDQEILDRLDVRLLDVQPGDYGWDVFSLDYKVTGPISAVFGRKTITRYLMLFNSLWRAKRMEWILARVWTRQTVLYKSALPIVPELQPILHTTNLLSSEMIHFVHQMAYYTAFEVMECSWAELMKRLKSAENLDEVIDAHEEFLNSVIRRALLGEGSRDLLTQIRAIYDRVVEFDAVQSRLYTEAVAESDARRNYESQIRRLKSGQSLSQDIKDADLGRRFTFAETIPKLDTQLKIVSQSYQDMVKTLLLQLTVNSDQSLQCLSFRLDFNTHYKKKDARGSITLPRSNFSIRD